MRGHNNAFALLRFFAIPEIFLGYKANRSTAVTTITGVERVKKARVSSALAVSSSSVTEVIVAGGRSSYPVYTGQQRLGLATLDARQKMTTTKISLNPKHPERVCWGCDKYCSADDLRCGNGTIRTQHPIELFGEDWMEWELGRINPEGSGVAENRDRTEGCKAAEIEQLHVE
jgi:hypothetical protein